MHTKTSFDYMNPVVPANLDIHKMPLVLATAENIKGYGTVVTDYKNHHVPIVTWPHTGWRKVDVGTGNEGGYVEGIFKFWWEGDILYGENTAVNDRYILGWSELPEIASATNHAPTRDQLLIWHANHHPDGGQLFYPLDGQPFIAALAKTDDDMQPKDWVAFYCDGSFGICMEPGIWHEAITPLTPTARFFDKQGRVHARVSCDFPREFGKLLSIPLNLDEMKESL